MRKVKEEQNNMKFIKGRSIGKELKKEVEMIEKELQKDARRESAERAEDGGVRKIDKGVKRTKDKRYYYEKEWRKSYYVTRS